MNRSGRVRTVAVAGTALAVVAGIGIGVAGTSTAASSRWVTALATAGDVTQTYTATGTITRKNTTAAAFGVAGTVKTVDVAVGDEVQIGEVLATVKRGPLQLAVLNAETAVAQKKAALYAAKHPASTSSGGSGGSGASAGSSGSGASAGSGGSAGAGGSGGSSGSGSGGATVTIDPAVLSEAASRINLAVLAEAEKCEPVFGSILPAAEPTPDPTATADPTPSGDPTADPTATETAAAAPTADSTTRASAEPTAEAEPTEQATETTKAAPTESPSQLAANIEANDPTKEELQECANARAEVLAANENLQAVVSRLLTPAPGGTGGTGSSLGTKSSSARKSSSSGSSTSVSASAVASAEADLLEAQQALQVAEDELDASKLLAPISGTVGTVGLAAGDSASAGSITIVGEGSAVVTFELPLKIRKLVELGQAVTVTPAGSSQTLEGKLTAISVLETSGTSGDSPTYATTVSVPDPNALLASGAKASVSTAVKAVTGVVTVPASAVTPTGTGTATVQVLATATAESPETVTVSTGAVGAGRVEITGGLANGQIVVLADTTKEIPANATRRRSSTTSGASASASAAATAQPTAQPTASAQPTATAGR